MACIACGGAGWDSPSNILAQVLTDLFPTPSLASPAVDLTIPESVLIKQVEKINGDYRGDLGGYPTGIQFKYARAVRSSSMQNTLMELERVQVSGQWHLANMCMRNSNLHGIVACCLMHCTAH